MLYICGTPIGNLEDMTFRQINTLKTVDLIAAEDTRHSRKLLTHFEIQTPMTSYHEHNKAEKTNYLIKEMLAGKQIALITDSGMPVISDPGLEIVAQCYEHGIQVTTVPGPTAFVSGFVLSGISSGRFVFEGFLSKKQKKHIDYLKTEERAIILYESPHKLLNTLQRLNEVLGSERVIAVTRELTKKYEEVKRMTLGEAVSYYESNTPMGEFVLVIEGQVQEKEVSDVPIITQVENYINQGYAKNDAIKQVAKDMELPKRVIYQACI